MPATSAFLQNWLEPIFGRWLYVDSMGWTVVGFLGAAIFGSRFILQWLQSEKEKKLVVPWYFWHLSFWGSVLNLLYFLHLDKAPLILGNCFLPFLYGRNILFLRRAGTKGGGRKVFAAVMVLVLGGFAWSMFFGDDDKEAGAAGSADERTKTLLKETAAALKAYRGNHAQLPSGDSRVILAALYKDVPQTDSFTKLNAEGDLLDAWGHPIQIYISGNGFMVRSAGKNGAFDDSLSERLDDVIVQGSAL
ncbi:MAG: lipid-A-disaccharide synthase N-terminal domain-containing protein [Roseimicrobium sp.]